MRTEELKDIYFLGIGGIGMSALASYFHRKGVKVSGYDKVNSVVTDALEKEGIEIFYHADVHHVSNKDLVIYTPAIPTDHAELLEVRQNGTPLYKRAQALGLLSKPYRTLAVAGTHGKTTTSIMLTHLLKSSGVDCTAFLGGLSRNLNGNFVVGDAEWLVAEADEYDRSFLSLNPELAIINSMDPDHLDIYGDQESFKTGFMQFASQSQRLLVHDSLKNDFDGMNVESFGIEAGDFQARNIKQEGLATSFDFFAYGEKLRKFRMPTVGDHNVYNMTAAIATAWKVGGELEGLAEGVASYAGIYRRFEVKFEGDHVSYIDDYAHHPTELEAAISTARAVFPDRKVLVIFQPHLFTRTRDFAKGFTSSLNLADEVFLMDIYPAREEPIEGVQSEMLAIGLEKEWRMVAKGEISKDLEERIQTKTIVLSLGAGDIDREIDSILECVKEINEKMNA